MFLPVPARAVSFADFVNGGIANSAFGAALSVGTQNFTNYALYQIYQRLSLTRLTIIDGFELLHSDLEYLSSMNSKLTSISNLSSSLLTNVSTILNSVKNSAGTAIQALQSAQSGISSLVSILGYDGAIADRLSSNGIIARRLAYESADGSVSTVGTMLYGLRTIVQSYLPYLSTISELLNVDGVLASRLSSSGIIAQRLAYTNPDTGAVSTLGTMLYDLRDYLKGIDFALIPSRLAYVNSETGSVSTVGTMLYGLRELAQQTLPKLSTISDLLNVGGVIPNYLSSSGAIAKLLSSVNDGIEVGSTSIVQRLAQLPGILQDGFSSVVEGLGNVAITFPDSITATLSGDATISAETDVAGEAAQTASLYDSLVGEVDVDGLRSQLDGLVGVLRTSFPFGCVFVLIDACDALSAAPVAPVFSADLPAVVGTYHVEIDLSFFDSVATLWRGGMLVIYVAGLYSATKQWVFNGGGESA